MVWKIITDRSYYYRSVRVGGRVRHIYVGGGVVGQEAAAFDAIKREERRAKRAAARAEIEEITNDGSRREINDALDALVASARREATALLEAVGYHQHDRGEWRSRKRGPRKRRV